MYNMDALELSEEIAGECDPSIEVHTSFATKKPYSTEFAKQLDQRAVFEGYSGKYWFPMSIIKSRKIPVRRGARSSRLMITSSQQVFCASQLVDPKQLMLLPLSGGTMSPIMGTQVLQQHMAADKGRFTHAVYWTQRHLEVSGLQVAEGEGNPCVNLSGSGKPYNMWNMHQLSDVEEAKKKAGTVVI